MKNPKTGRNGLTAQQVLRSLTLMRVKNWNYRELRERIADGYTLRRFTRFYSSLVPKHDAFNRAFNRLTPTTLEAINEMVVKSAVKLGLENGNKLRVDTTVVESDIHHPTDSTLLWDSTARHHASGRIILMISFRVACRHLPIARVAPDAACKRSNE